MGRVGREISTQLLRIPGIATVEQQIGRAEQGEDPWGPHRSEFHVELKPGKAAQQDAAAEAIRAVLKATPGIQFEVLTFLGDRIGESISGETQPVAISLFGENLAELDAAASRLVPLLSSIPGAAEVQMKSPGGSPVLQVQLRSDRLLALGVSRADALDAVQVAYQANPVAHVFRGNESIGVGVVLADDGQASPERVGELLLSTGSGTLVPLKAVADIALSSGRHSILHDGARRRQVVSCNVHGRDLDEFVKELRGTLQSKLELPRGVYLAVGGAAGAADTAEREMLLHSLIAAVGIVALLSLVLRTRANLGLVLANVPFALVGGVMAVALNGWLHHEHPSLNLGSVVGFVTLFGITMRNSIMLISHYEHLVLKEGRSWDASLALTGASERFGPILMTALVTGLGLLPLALGAGEAGREIEGPMAVVILGGLVTSTLLNLLVLPALALRFASFEVNKSA
jgi:Cu/Ag efflux pump CusA